jgi:predicted esterase
MEQHPIVIPYQARYFTLGTLNHQTRQIWFVLHGYGQLAEYFLKKFNVLEDQNIFVIAPEGLAHFYLENLQTTGRASDRVGASWMTKENRLVDIQNYLAYLNVIDQKVVGNIMNIPVTILGFSQGAATASRWAAEGKVNFQRLILWAGVFPPDMDFHSAHQILEHKETCFVYGTSDPFINDSRFAEMNLLTAKLGITPRVISFDGKHEMDSATLLKLI